MRATADEGERVAQSHRTRLARVATAVTVTLAVVTLVTGSVAAVTADATPGATAAGNETTPAPRTPAQSAGDVPVQAGSNAVASTELPAGTTPVVGAGAVVGVVVAGLFVAREERDE